MKRDVKRAWTPSRARDCRCSSRFSLVETIKLLRASGLLEFSTCNSLRLLNSDLLLLEDQDRLREENLSRLLLIDYNN